MSKKNDQFQKLIDILELLLSPNGCEWDKKQTHQSLIPYLLEETYEVVESIENNDMTGLKEELGDLMLHVVFQAKLAENKGHFNIYDSLEEISSKLIRRHPHVFTEVMDSDGSKLSWEKAKKEEKNRSSIIDGVPKSLPALTRANRVQEKASSVGFDWNSIEPIWDKIEEEIVELKDAITSKDNDRIIDEMGDVFFSFVNLSRYLGIDPESSVRFAITKFSNRFRKVEKLIEEQGKKMNEADLEELDSIWHKIKKQ